MDVFEPIQPKVSLRFYVIEDHMLDKYLYLISNPLKIKTLLLLLSLLEILGEAVNNNPNITKPYN